jgi:hypothetical protein
MANLYIKGLIKRLLASQLVRRAAHSFWQAAVASFVVSIPLATEAYNTGGRQAGRAALISLLAGAVAAGLSAAKTALVSRS